MADLRTTLCGIELKNPVIAASGTFGYGGEFASQAALERIGAIVVKGLSRERIHGNASPRVTETAAGMLNAIGLQNVGVKAFVSEKLPLLGEFGVPVFANVFGYDLDDYVEVLSVLEDAEGLAAYELNVSCPNTKRGGLEFGAHAGELSRAVEAARAVAKRRPLLVKLSPNVTDISEMARAAVEAGADGLSLINTLRGLAVDAHRRRPVLSTGSGGLSGPAIKPVALHMVHQVSQSVDVPIIGVGGIATAEDIVEFLLCGATAVQVGTASFWDPARVADLPGELEAYLDAEGTTRAAELTGKLRPPAGAG
ncbi:MAG: dihydroorotate dehydrogenase [Bryobacterales bacterium]|nr:dihydroorotate dehydrogenase [Bryobacterales bacterium]